MLFNVGLMRCYNSVSVVMRRWLLLLCVDCFLGCRSLLVVAFCCYVSCVMACSVVAFGVCCVLLLVVGACSALVDLVVNGVVLVAVVSRVVVVAV